MIKPNANKGFTLVELLMTMLILGFVLAATSDTFVTLLNQYKQQSKITETNIEGVIGLELLRQDLNRAGFGLPWYIPTGTSYPEVEAGNAGDAYNELTTGTTTSAPRPILSGNDVVGAFNTSDVLVIKAANITRNATSQKWTYLMPGAVYKIWGKDAEDLQGNEYMIVLSPGKDDSDRKTLVLNTGNLWYGLFTSATITSFSPAANDTYPRQVYGIADSVPRMPFNRADYYILGSANITVPSRCAPNTGVLYKSMISHADGQRRDPQPLMDCVADMQVVYELDTDGTGSVTISNDISAGMTAQNIRTQVKEVRVYILTHDGQRDKNYTHSTTTIYVGDAAIGGGRNFDIGTNVNYRWRLYTIAVQPKNL